MEDDKIKELFKGYEPGLTSTATFMDGLERRLDAVALVKTRHEKLRARSRRALRVAMLAGFCAGFGTAMALPRITAALSGISLRLPEAYRMLPAWMAIATVTLLTSLSAYNLTLAIPARKK